MKIAQRLSALIARVFDGSKIADFSRDENSQLFTAYMAFLQQLEHTYQQFKAGVVDESVFEGYGWRNAILQTPHFKHWWSAFGGPKLLVTSTTVNNCCLTFGMQQSGRRRRHMIVETPLRRELDDAGLGPQLILIR